MEANKRLHIQLLSIETVVLFKVRFITRSVDDELEESSK